MKPNLLMNSRTVRVWDLPTRLFHWLLAILVVAAYVTAEIGGSLIEWHGRVGIAITGLLAFRLVWGVIGSTYARFADFVPTPARLLRYLTLLLRGREPRHLGHNPAGAVMILYLLGATLVIGVTVSFASQAQESPPAAASAEACLLLENDAARLACYDSALGRTAADTRRADQAGVAARGDRFLDLVEQQRAGQVAGAHQKLIHNFSAGKTKMLFEELHPFFFAQRMMGFNPFIAAPTPRPAKPSSEIGVSYTRSGPNSSSIPWDTL